MSEQSQFMDEIFESAQFQILLREQVTSIVNGITEARKICSAAIPSIVTEIGNHIDSIIEFQVKNSFNEEYTAHLQQNYDLRKEVDQIKVQLLKLSAGGVGESKIISISRIETQPELLLDRSREREKGSSDNLQMIKLQKEVEGLKISLQKASDTSILKFVSQSNAQIHKSIQQNYSKLQHQIHEMTQRNLDTSLQKTTSDILDLKYETLEQRLEGINKNQKELIERFKNLETGIMEKYETNFSSVWNVITHMETSLKNSNSSRKEKEKEPGQLENLRSFVSPSAKSSKKISFPNIFSGLSWN